MDQIVFGDYTLQDLAIYAGIAVGGLILLTFIGRLFRGRTAEAQFEKASCSCGWTGQASRFAGRCPRCNTPLGKGQARPQQGKGRG